MTDPDNTLAAIDAAVDAWVGRDWAISDDAMHWAPEPPRRSLEQSATMVAFDEVPLVDRTQLAARIQPVQA